MTPKPVFTVLDYCLGALGVQEQNQNLHFNSLIRIALHFKRFGVNDGPENLQAKKSNWHLANESAVQLAGSCAGAGGDASTVCLERLSVALSQT